MCLKKQIWYNKTKQSDTVQIGWFEVRTRLELVKAVDIFLSKWQILFLFRWERKINLSYDVYAPYKYLQGLVWDEEEMRPELYM